MVRAIRIGTRGSALARVQTQWVVKRLREAFPDVQTEVVEIQTRGDRIQNLPLSKVGGKGLFIKEIEQALLNGEIDLAVHSLKDMPAALPEELRIGAVSEREDPRDVLIAQGGRGLAELPAGARIGTGSLRRTAQLLHRRPDLEVVPLRGNINTRLRKISERQLDGIILAAAGLNRMGWEDQISEYFDPADWVPAVGQGALAIEIRGRDEGIRAMAAGLNHPDTHDAVTAERAFLAQIGGSCQVPVGAYAVCAGEELRLTALIADPLGSRILRETRQGMRKDAIEIGCAAAMTLLRRGGSAILEATDGRREG